VRNRTLRNSIGDAVGGRGKKNGGCANNSIDSCKKAQKKTISCICQDTGRLGLYWANP